VQPDHHHDDGADETEDQAWRAIVENYGDRAEIDEPPAPAAPTAPADPASSAPFGGRFGDLRAFPSEDENDPFVAEEVTEEDGYVPPEPPPLPRVEPDRMLAWAGVLGSPLVLLCALIFSISLPSWVGYLLVAGFVGGFLYLVVKMPREPRDPWDDGAQV
jgi:hypothetical protein